METASEFRGGEKFLVLKISTPLSGIVICDTGNTTSSLSEHYVLTGKNDDNRAQLDHRILT